jgi:putative transposase
MKPKGSPGYKSLRKGRISQENARYFVTLCTLKRQPVLCRDSVPEIVFETLQLCSEDFELIASVIMPDHVHVIIRLGNVTLSRAIQVFKSLSAIAINRKLDRKGPLWQPTSFGHKFRGDYDLAPILSYLWNNPEIPGQNFRCRKAEWLWFKSTVTQDVEYPAWLREHPMGCSGAVNW